MMELTYENRKRLDVGIKLYSFLNVVLNADEVLKLSLLNNKNDGVTLEDTFKLVGFPIKLISTIDDHQEVLRRCIEVRLAYQLKFRQATSDSARFENFNSLVEIVYPFQNEIGTKTLLEMVGIFLSRETVDDIRYYNKTHKNATKRSKKITAKLAAAAITHDVDAVTNTTTNAHPEITAQATIPEAVDAVTNTTTATCSPEITALVTIPETDAVMTTTGVTNTTIASPEITALVTIPETDAVMTTTGSSYDNINPYHHPAPLNIEVINGTEIESPNVSPLSVDATSTSQLPSPSSTNPSSLSTSSLPKSRFVSGSTSQCSSSSSSLLDYIPITKVSLKTKKNESRKIKTIGRLLGLEASRKTSSQAQKSRMKTTVTGKALSFMYKVGSFMLDLTKKDQNPFIHLNTADKIANNLNDLFAVEDGLNGYQLLSGVKAGYIATTPMKKGRPNLLSDEDQKDIADLLYTTSLIEQHNGENRLKRPQLTAMVGNLINDKREKENDVLVDERNLYRHLEEINSPKQNMIQPDSRDAIRVKWCRYSLQKKHYENWEQLMIDEQYARLPLDDKELEEKGHIVFHKGNECVLFMNMDEMRFTLDQNSEGVGGRPGMVPSAKGENDSGEAANKSSYACTIVHSILGLEVAPPLIIFPTKAKEDCFNIKAQIAHHFRQIKGKYGYDEEKVYDVQIAFSPNGSMNGEILQSYILFITTLVPEIRNEPGKRLIMKADMGPGRFYEGFITSSYDLGVIFFPGLPNGTEIGQELDQIFALVKQCMYSNRDKIFIAMCRAYGSGKARLDPKHVALCLNGGKWDVKNDNGEIIEVVQLEDAIARITPEKILNARIKCGYWPATRNALNDPKLTHEVFEEENPDGNLRVNIDADPMGELLNAVESWNHELVDKLAAKGYSLAENLFKRHVKRVTVEQVASRMEGPHTVPNTRERQDALMQISTAGQFYRVTRGGGIFNSADMILAISRKEKHKTVATLQKRKNAALKAVHNQTKASNLFKNKRYQKWTKNDFIIALKYKQGDDPSSVLEDRKFNTNMKRDDLKEIYERYYKGQRRSNHARILWTNEDEERLQKIINDEIEQVEETAIYGRALEYQKEYLSKKLLNLSQPTATGILCDYFAKISSFSRIEISKALLSSLDEDEKRAILDTINPTPVDINNILHGEDDDSSVSSMSTLVELEDENQGSNNSGTQMQEAVVVGELMVNIESNDELSNDDEVASFLNSSDQSDVRNEEQAFIGNVELTEEEVFLQSDDESEAREETQEAGDNSSNEQLLTIKLKSFLIKNDGVKLLKDELIKRQISFDEKEKSIKKLKDSCKSFVDNDGAFHPVSTLILEAIQNGKLK